MNLRKYFLGVAIGTLITGTTNAADNLPREITTKDLEERLAASERLSLLGTGFKAVPQHAGQKAEITFDYYFNSRDQNTKKVALYERAEGATVYKQVKESEAPANVIKADVEHKNKGIYHYRAFIIDNDGKEIVSSQEMTVDYTGEPIDFTPIIQDFTQEKDKFLFNATDIGDEAGLKKAILQKNNETIAEKELTGTYTWTRFEGIKKGQEEYAEYTLIIEDINGQQTKATIPYFPPNYRGTKGLKEKIHTRRGEGHQTYEVYKILGEQPEVVSFNINDFTGNNLTFEYFVNDKEGLDSISIQESRDGGETYIPIKTIPLTNIEEAEKSFPRERYMYSTGTITLEHYEGTGERQFQIICIDTQGNSSNPSKTVKRTFTLPEKTEEQLLEQPRITMRLRSGGLEIEADQLSDDQGLQKIVIYKNNIPQTIIPGKGQRHIETTVPIFQDFITGTQATYTAQAVNNTEQTTTTEPIIIQFKENYRKKDEKEAPQFNIKNDYTAQEGRTYQAWLGTGMFPSAILRTSSWGERTAAYIELEAEARDFRLASGEGLEQLLLEESTDQGKTWKTIATKPAAGEYESWKIPIERYVDEEHTFRLTAIDNDGNQDSSQTNVTFKDDKTDPPPVIHTDINYEGQFELEARDIAWNKGFKTITI
ncbi:MAG: hypothetical protein Q7R96_04995, partial [Nanoarchaeota archaeon]|nr:hypothetical protein [Nanoarchaeota archaeon]